MTPPSGATPHEMGHVWEGTTGGFNGTDSSGSWWECTANWMQLQFLNSYPQSINTLFNGPLYPCHGRDYYDTWMIWETALNDARYGAAWVNNIWTNATPEQQTSEFILDRMVRLDQSGSADKTAGMRDLWGDMTKKMITWDFSRQRWLAQGNSADDGSDWGFARACRTALIPMPLNSGWYRPCREHTPLQYGFNMMKLTVTAGTTVSCNFQPICDPVRQSDFRACLVAVSNNGDARYSSLWNAGNNSITLSTDESKLYLVVIATPAPQKIMDPVWSVMTRDAGLQFPYKVSFTNATPTNITYPAQGHTGMHQHSNGLGWVSDTATVASTAYVGPNAQVLNSAQVLNYARIDEYAVVKESAQVRDNAVVSGHALVFGNSQVYGYAKVRDWAEVGGDAQVYENARITEHAYFGDSGNKAYGSAVVKGMSYIYSPSVFYGSIINDGDTANGNGDPANGGVVADHGVHFGWQWGQNQSIYGQLTDNGYKYSSLTFERQNPIFACDEYGVMHGFEINGCRSTIDSGGTPRGGYVMALNGTNQYVELHNSVNDFKDMSVAVWVKWTGTANDQKIWSMGDGASKVMFLTPKNATTSRVRFSITDGATTQYIDGAAAIGTAWTHVVVTFSGNTGTLYVNGAQVGQNTSMTLDPDALNAAYMQNCNYLGRDTAGNYFQGSLDNFAVYNKTLSSGEVTTLYNTAAPSPITPTTDTTAPTPNAATWLVNPTAISDSAITMSATPGTDASGWVEYYFTCTAGGGHDSGWVSMNRYTDVGLTPSTLRTYTVKMRDKNGNTTTASTALSATTQTSSAGTASFAYAPVGVDGSSITMRATKLTNASGLTEYKFTRNDAVTSGWQSSPTWTNTGLTTNNTYTYTVQVRDGRGNTSAVSGALGATVKDMAAPILPISEAYWGMMPYATIDNKISMTAQDGIDPAGVQYYFHCTAGGAPDSAWQDSPTYVTPNGLADGTYSFQYKLRDKSAQLNESGYSAANTAKITPTTGYHTCTFAQVSTLPDDYLVTFNGVVIKANSDNYVVKDVAGSTTAVVKTDSYGQATDSSNLLKICQIKGHLWTYSSVRQVTYATVTALMDAPTFAISGKVSNASGGAGIAGATVYISVTPNASVNPVTTATTDSSGNFSKGIPNGTWYVATSAANFFPSSDQTVTVAGYPVANVNFSLNAAYTITASAGTGGSITPSGAVLVSGGSNQAFTIAANGGYSIAGVTVDGVNQGSITSYTFSNVTANHTISATFTANSRSIPQTGSLIDSAVTDTFPASGNTGNWASYLPSGKTYTAMVSPTVGSINTAKAASCLRTDSDGYDCGDHGSTSIPCTGATIVTVVKPTRNTTGDSWNSIVDIFYDRLVLGIYNNTGQVIVRRNGSFDSTGYVIPDGQVTVLSLVCQSNGNYIVYANGSQVYSNTTTSTMTSLVPGVPGGYATHINVGRNNPDGWTGFNGNIGDFFIYSIALSAADRQTLENDLSSRFGSVANRTITASAGTGGSISPTGAVSVPNGNSATFVALPNIGYTVSQMTVDSVNQGAISSYTFTNVTANHTIAAAFSTVPTWTITASAGSGGSISPTGAVVVNQGSSKTFTITPNTGYSVSQVTVDSVNQGAITSYTFNNVTANHTISATFTAQVNTITASAATGGTITPSGAVGVNYGANQSFTIAANANYAISSVLVDGVDVGAVTSYTFNSVIAAHTISAVFIAGARSIPAADKLIFGIDTKDIPSSGAITSWAWLWPTGSSMSTIGSPTATTVSSVKWEQNRYADGDGLLAGNYTSAIACTGATAVAVVKPIRSSDSGNWRSIVDVFYNRFILGIANNTGQVYANVNGNSSWAPGGTEIPDGQATVLSLVGQSNGTYKVWANGTQIMTGTATSNLTTLDPLWNGGGTGFWSYINVGRNQPDGWTTFNGDIGDVFLYKTALSDDQRLRLEADVKSKFGIGGGGSTYTITASAGTGGTITPSGAVVVNSGANQTFAIAANGGYAISDVVVDGISVGIASSITFTNVLANHTVSATFVATGSFTITASAGTGGTITPSGAVVVSPGANQTFAIAANTGYAISQVTVDSVNQGAITSYTFTNVQANHTISATFVATGSFTITASAGTGGTITPSGAVVVNSGANQSFTIAPSTGYYLTNVAVDGVSLGALRSYTFTNVTANHTIAATFTAHTDLVAYWKFDETSGTTAYDCTVNAKNATLSGSCTWVAGKTNNALNIPGGTSYASVPTGIVSTLTNFSIATWVKMTTVSTNMRIFDFGTSTSNYMMLTPKHANSSGKIRYSIVNGGVTQSITGTAALPTGSWQYVVVTLSGSTGTLYVNGVQVGQLTTMTKNPSVLGSTTINRFGDSKTSNHPHLNGAIDGFKIYNRALSAAEVTTLYGSGAGIASVVNTSDPIIDLLGAGLEPGLLTSWPNAGTLGGEFTNEDTTPVVEDVDGKTAVTFDGEDWMKASFLAPASITGNKPFTTMVWAYSPLIDTDGALLSWSTNAQLNFGNAAGVPGAYAWHLISATYDGSAVKYYVDGILKAAEMNILAINTDLPVILGSAYTINGNTYYPTFNFTGSVGGVKVFDRALNQSEISSIFNAGF
ncbi:MAG: DUF6055 domain-containing protein [Armatimonadetes bacterium]|nr:DUF6055 domain-containing protein [Armatimonadota bacterium]